MQNRFDCREAANDHEDDMTIYMAVPETSAEVAFPTLPSHWKTHRACIVFLLPNRSIEVIICQGIFFFVVPSKLTTIAVIKL